MKLVLFFLGCLWPLITRVVPSNNDAAAENGLLSGVWQFQQNDQCVTFVLNEQWCRRKEYRVCKPVGYLSDDCTRLSTLDTHGKIRDTETGKYYCYLSKNPSSTSKFNAPLALCDSNDIRNSVKYPSELVSARTGFMSFELEGGCWRPIGDPDRTLIDDTTVDVVTNHFCYSNIYSQFRLIAPSMSWFSFDSPKAARSLTRARSYCQPRKRLCTIAEVCPSTAEDQSIVAAIGDRVNSLLPVAGDRIVDAVTCKPVNPSDEEIQSFTSEGVVCCSNTLFPKPKKFLSNAIGHLVHRSGKCIHLIENNLVLKSSCSERTALMHWNQQGNIRKKSTCIWNSPFQALSCPYFQFTGVNSLQNVFTGLCLVPNVATDIEDDDIPEDTEVTEKDLCGISLASFQFRTLHGYMQHSTTKCIGLNNAGKLVLKTSCDSYDQLFHQELDSSKIFHSFSGKCIKQPTAVEEVLSLTADCDTHGGNFRYNGYYVKLVGSNKCIKPEEDMLVMREGCSEDPSLQMEFTFIDSSPACDEGFERITGACFPINNCKKDNGGCLDNAECVYVGPGSNTCACPPGYDLEGDGVTCTECPERNCYSHCQFFDDIETKRVLSRETHLKLRFLNVKTSDLQDYIGENTREITVLTRQLTVSGVLTLGDGMVITIFADEIVNEFGATIELFNDQTIRVIVQQEGDEDNRLVCENNHIGKEISIHKSTLNIHLGNSSAPFHCSSNYTQYHFARQYAILTKTTPRPRPIDEMFISMVLDCARVVAQQKTFAKGKKLVKGRLPVRLTQHVFDEINRAREDGTNLTASLLALEIKAIQLMEDLAMRAQGIYKVPYLSLKSHEKILTLLKDDAKLAIDKYSKFERSSMDFEPRIEAMDSMTNVMTALVSRNNIDIEAVKRELHNAEKDRKKMLANLEEAKVALETAREGFERGVREYQVKMWVNAIFTIIGGVASVFSGGAAGILGFTLELGDLAEDVGKITKSLFKLTIIINILDGINQAATTFTALHYDVLPLARSGVSSYYSKTLPSRNGDSLAVMIKEWDILEANADAFLGMGTPSTEISGTADYLAALKTVAVWGRGYHEQSIIVQGLHDALIDKQLLHLEQNKAQNDINEARKRALSQREMNKELFLQMSLQKQRLRQIMISKLMMFCNSYFYNWLSDCPVMPTMSDDLYALHGKINVGLSSSINAVENFAPFVPQEFEETFVITDNDDCEARYHSLITSKEAAKKQSVGSDQPAVNTQRCPLSDLKLTNSFMHQINFTDGKVFLSHDRVHVDEVEVYLKGATCNGCASTYLNLRISFSGLMKDVFQGKEYEFISPPRVLEYSYQMEQDDNYKVMKSGKVSTKFKDFYDGISALTTWSVRVMSGSSSEELNLGGVTEVWLKLKGNALLSTVNEEETTGDINFALVSKMSKNVNKMKTGWTAQNCENNEVKLNTINSSAWRADCHKRVKQNVPQKVTSGNLSKATILRQVDQNKRSGPSGPREAATSKSSRLSSPSKATQVKMFRPNGPKKVSQRKSISKARGRAEEGKRSGDGDPRKVLQGYSSERSSTEEAYNGKKSKIGGPRKAAQGKWYFASDKWPKERADMIMENQQH